MSTNKMSIPLAVWVWVSLFTVASTRVLHDKRIINGKEAEPFSHPYMVSLFALENSTTGYGYDCGGVVLDSNWVLTAAHCVEDDNGVNYAGNKIYLYFGAHKDVTNEAMAERNGQHVIKHPKFNSTTLANDIALIRVDTPVELGDRIQAATLTRDDSDFIYETCLLVGWGETEEGESSEFLREVNITYIPDELCAHIWKEYAEEIDYEEYDIDEARVDLETWICAFDISPGPQGLGSSCKGDSGGPMMCGEDRNTLVGITSWGTDEPKNCSWVSMYTRVSKYLTWIEAIRGFVDSLYEE